MDRRVCASAAVLPRNGDDPRNEALQNFQILPMPDLERAVQGELRANARKPHHDTFVVMEDELRTIGVVGSGRVDFGIPDDFRIRLQDDGRSSDGAITDRLWSEGYAFPGRTEPEVALEGAAGRGGTCVVRKTEKRDSEGCEE